MEDIVLLDAIERYLNGNMSVEEKNHFDQLRKSTPEIDQMVVEHKLFLQQIDVYAEHANLRHTLQEVHNNLIEKGEINEGEEVTAQGKLIPFWQKYKKITAIAASIAGLTALIISGLVAYYSPATSKDDIQQLSMKVNKLEQKTNVLNAEINKDNKDHTKIPAGKVWNTGGTGFLIDAKGYIITNAHVLKGSGAVVVNNKGQEFNVTITYIDEQRDLAILKINDDDFKPLGSLPYSIKKAGADLGEEIYTLGYPRNEIVYNMGYLSAKTGYEGDTSSLQMSLPANPGNSGGPVFNKNGEIVGILSARETQAEGVVFAIKSKGIYQVIDDLKNNDSTQKIKLPVRSSLKGVDRVQQIKQVEDCIFLVKSYN
ncbi:MAG: S1C family serine protease [Chitinophagaceae bacterium]